MIFKRGDVYRNKEDNVPCFIKKNSNDMHYLFCWTYLDKETMSYVEYEAWYTHKELLNEMSKGYLDVITYGDKERLVLTWIPQHSFLSL